ncbi:MAG: c-type cytochrome [Bacteroidota bacterium]
MAGSVFCLLMAGVVQGQEIEEPGEKGSFLLRPETTFQHYCAPCHGETAQGDGRYFSLDLQPRPRDLTEAKYMNTRTDEELVASISGGTASIGKSNLCPPWGKTLGRERIEGMVTYLRSLSRTPAVQDTTEGTASVTVGDLVESGSPLQLASLIVMSLLLIGTAWLQWRRL